MTKTAPNALATTSKAFCKDEEGSMTVGGLFFFVAAGMLGALALDVTSFFASRTHLQAAADQAAHAAIYNRTFMGAGAAKERALDVVQSTLPTGRYGAALSEDDIEFGTYVASTGTFVPDPNATGAVRVQTSFLNEKENAAQTFLFRLMGRDDFDIVTSAIYTTYRPGCMREGFIAQGVVDIQSNNAFGNGFCIHSNTYVSLNSNNTFEPGTVVSMPDITALDLPKSGFETNEGLYAALRNGSMNIRVLSRIDNMVYFYETGDLNWANYPDPALAPDMEELPDYITTSEVVVSMHRTVETSELEEGRIHYIRCQGNSGLTIDATSDTLRNVIIISPCEIKFKNGSAIEDARVISKATSDDAISATSGLRIGRDDNCGDGGGAQLISFGGMKFPADLQIYGSQLLAKGDITFAANANGVQGASMIAGGEIDGTSNMNMKLCLSGMEDNIELDYYRLAL